ncbi:MAG: outer membrane beta-barrel protein [Chitinophagaceae bacterium]
MKQLLAFLACTIALSRAHAQTGTITVKVNSEQQAALENVTVELLRPDSSLVKLALTDQAGLASFTAIPWGPYLVKAGMIDHVPSYTIQLHLTAAQSQVQAEIVLHPRSADMQGVTVTAKKPFVQRLADRIVVNVENSIVSAGSTAMDVLERSPGVRIGQSDAISLAGKPGVIILINGKNLPMSGEELGNYLRSLPSAAIERIDIITNPSARYDAAGNAGIIDIRMKKDQKLGANGTLTAGYGQGKYARANTGGTFNYRSKKINVFGNLNYSYTGFYNHMETRRYFFQDRVYQGSYDQDNLITRTFSSSVARIGLDYFVNKKTVLGVLVTGNQSLTGRDSDNESLVLDQANHETSSFLTGADGYEDYHNYVINLNLKHIFDTSGRELTADFDRAGYFRDWGSLFSTGYYDAAGQLTQPLFLARTDQDGITGIHTLKADYTHPMKKAVKLEAGIKASFVRSDNDVLFFDRSTGTEKLDSAQSNSFRYKENINAAYVNLGREWKKFSAQVGLRAEQTNVNTWQVFDNLRFDTSYLELFPSAFFNYRLSPDNTIGVSVSRRIDRPGYNQLNPFKIFVDPSFYASGDPLLKPSFTWSYELSYTRKQLNVALAYSRTVNPVTYVLIPSETQARVTIQTPVNLRSFDYFGVSFNAPVRIAKWWNVINNGNIYYAHNKGYIANTVVNSQTLNAQFSTNHNLSIAEGWSGEVNFTFDSGNNTGVMKDQFYWILGAGVQKTVLSKKGTIRFNVTDILWRQWPRFRSIYRDYHEYLTAKRDTRIANLSFTWRFGKNTITQSRRRTTASEEERRRAG